MLGWLGPFKDTKGQWGTSLEGRVFPLLLPFFTRSSPAKSTRVNWDWLTPGILAGRSFSLLTFSHLFPSPLRKPSGVTSLASKGQKADQAWFEEVLKCVC